MTTARPVDRSLRSYYIAITSINAVSISPAIQSVQRGGEVATHLDIRLGNRPNLLKEVFKVSFGDVVVKVLDRELASGLYFVDFGFVLGEKHGCSRRSVARRRAATWATGVVLISVMLP